MARKTRNEIEARRAFHRELLNIARLLRLVGMALVLLGTVGIALAQSGAWFAGPSWVSFAIGWALILSGAMRRVRLSRVGSDE